MIVVTVARRPLAEQNVASNTLKHEVGALNINGTRIAHDPSVNLEHKQRQQAASEEAAVHGAFGAGALVGKEIATYKPGGRWPANLILRHRTGCRQVGMKEEPGYVINRFSDGMKPFGEGAGHDYKSQTVAPTTVPVWECAQGCPIQDLDTNTSALPPSKGGYIRKHGGNQFLGSGLGDQRIDNPSGVIDSGGASRFFKQVVGSK